MSVEEKETEAVYMRSKLGVSGFDGKDTRRTSERERSSRSRTATDCESTTPADIIVLESRESFGCGGLIIAAFAGM